MLSTEDQDAISMEEGRSHRQSTSSVHSPLECSTQVTGSPDTGTVTPSPTSATVQEPADIDEESPVRHSGGVTLFHRKSAAPDSKFTIHWNKYITSMML